MSAIKEILWKVTILALILIGFYYLFMVLLAREFVNDNYSKFTHKSTSLIVGLSRAHNGISPGVLDSVLYDTPYEGGFLNFAFEKSQSPYGKIYLEAIKKKIPQMTTRGIFIMGVSPASFTAPMHFKSPQDIDANDKRSLIGKVSQLNTDPNFEYIRKGYAKSLYKGIFPSNERPTTVFHDNGWEEFKLYAEHYTVTQEDIENWTSQTMGGYKRVMKQNPEIVSNYRLERFRQTIAFLKQYGQVFVVRMPVNPLVLGMENTWWKEFNTEMTLISADQDVPYFNFSDATQYKTYDGSHLSSSYAKEFSAMLAKEIRQYYRLP